MLNFIQSLRLDNIKCQQHDQISNFICLDKQCQKKGLSCPLCQQTYHKDHTFKPFKYFLSQLTQPSSRSNNLTLISSQIDLIISQLQSSILSNKTNNLQEHQQLIKTFNTYINQLHHKIHHQFSIENQLKQFFQNLDHSQTQSIKNINAFINQFQLHQYEPQNQSNNIKLTNQQKYLYQWLDIIKQKKQDYHSLVKAKADTKDIMSLFVFTEVKQKVTFVFSQQFHHTSIKIHDKIQVKQQHNYSSNFALIEPLVIGKKKSMSKKSVKVKIDKLNSWVNLGICIKSKAISANYYFNTQDIGHGAYTISNDGYSWHNTDSSLNSYYHGWSFAQGDIVTMTYDPKSKSIKYTKQNSDKQHQLLCESVAGQQMYFCVTLNTHDQTVSLVQ